MKRASLGLVPLIVALFLAACAAEPQPVATPAPVHRGPALQPWPATRATESPAVDGLGLAQSSAGNEPIVHLAGTPVPAAQPGQPVAAGSSSGPQASVIAAVEVAGPAAIHTGTPVAGQGRQANPGWEVARASIPDGLTLVNDIVALTGDAAVESWPITVEAPPEHGLVDLLDLYAWDGQKWHFVPSTMNQNGMQPADRLAPTTQGLAVMQARRAGPPELGLWRSEQGKPAGREPAWATEIIAGSLQIQPGGQVSGETGLATGQGLANFARVSCMATSEALETSGAGLPAAGAARQQAIDALVAPLKTAGHAGLNLVCPISGDGQMDFVLALANELHANNLSLAVTLPLAEAGKQDAWSDLGQVADQVYLELPPDPRRYSPGGWVESRLAAATHLIDRRKLMLLVDTLAFEAMAGQEQSLSQALAWTTLVDESGVNVAATAARGESVTARIAGPLAGLTFDAGAGAYTFARSHAGQSGRVWLAGELKVRQRLALTNRYQLRGLAFLESPGEAEILDQALAAGQDLQATMVSIPEVEILWSVSDQTGAEVARREGNSASFVWQAGPKPGSYSLQATLRLGRQMATLDEAAIVVKTNTTPTPTEPTPTGSPTAGTPTPETPTPESTPRPKPVQAQARELSPLRAGPGLAFAQLGQLQAGQVVTLTGRTASSNWLQTPDGAGGDAWVLAVQMAPVADGDVWDLPEVAYEPPEMSPASLDEFTVGGQTHYLFRPNLMAQAGMRWVKFQHKWTPGESPDVVAGRIHEAHANGLFIMLSVTGEELYPTAIDFDSLITFLGDVAALGPDAIEVWNEANLDREWPAGQIDPASYVQQLLAPAYQAIKARNPDVLVISGALAPTGVDDGQHVWADDRFLAGMAAAGAANHLDCIGVHHNAGATSPYALSGHPGGSHYSWYFWPTLQLYHDTFGGQRPVCFTELGYLTADGFDSLPAAFAWAANTTLAQHAQWLADAVTISKLSGWVGLVIVFNVDFTHWGDDPQAGYAILRPDGSCPACSTLAGAMSASQASAWVASGATATTARRWLIPGCAVPWPGAGRRSC